MMILLALALARIAFGYQFQTVATLATDLVSRFGLTYTELGTLIGTYMVCGAFAALPLGLLGRRFGEGHVLAAGIACMALGACISAFSSSVTGLGLGRMIAGFGAVAMIVLQNKVIADWFAGRSFVTAISVTVCAFPVGMGLAGLALPLALDTLGLRGALLTDALPAGLSLLLFLASHRALPEDGPAARGFSLPSGRECIAVAFAGTTWMAYTAGFSGFVSYLPTALALRGGSAALIGMVMAIAMWGNVVGTLAGGGLASRFGGFNIFLCGTVAIVAGMAGLTATSWPILFAIVFGILGSIQPGVVMAATTLSMRPEHRAVGMGLFYTVYYIGGAIVPALCGVAADMVGKPEGGMWAGAALSALAIPPFLGHRLLSGRHASQARMSFSRAHSE